MVDGNGPILARQIPPRPPALVNLLTVAERDLLVPMDTIPCLAPLFLLRMQRRWKHFEGTLPGVK